MSVVLDEGVVATPRNVDPRVRRSVPGAAITLPIARCEASPSVRMRSSPIMDLGGGSGAIQIIPVAPRKFPSGRGKSTPGEGLLHCIFRSCGPVAGLHSRHPG
jgi:hypothetical protein